MAVLLGILELVLLLGAACGWGGLLVPRQAAGEGRARALVLRVAAGLGLIAGLTLAAAAGRLTGMPFFLLVSLAGLALLLRDGRRLLSPLPRWRAPRSPWPVLLLLLALVNLFYSLFPPTFYDSMVYHLAVPAYYLQHGGLAPWPTNFYASLPPLAEMLNLFALQAGALGVPRLLQFAAGLLLLLWLNDWQRRSFPAQAPWLAALLFYSIPEAGFVASSTKNDMLGLLFVAIAARLFLEATGGEKMEWRGMAGAGLFWGLALSTKYVFAFPFASFLLLALLRRTPGWRLRLKALLLVCLAALLVMAPWLAKNAALSGNPVYPYLNSVFPSPDWSAAQHHNLGLNLRRGAGPLQALSFFVEMFSRPYRHDLTAVGGVVLPPLLLLLPLAFRRRPARSLAAAALLALAALLLAARVPRYFLVVFLLLALPLGEALREASDRWPLLRRLLAPLLLALVAVNLVQQVRLQERFTLGATYLKSRVSGRLAGRDVSYLDALPTHRVAGFVNRTLGRGDRIAFLGEDRSFYFRAPALVSSFNDRNAVLECLAASRDPEEFRRALGRRGITHILFSLPGLDTLAGISVTHRLPASERGRLLDYLGALPLLYSDARYRVFRVPGIPAPLSP